MNSRAVKWAIFIPSSEVDELRVLVAPLVLFPLKKGLGKDDIAYALVKCLIQMVSLWIGDALLSLFKGYRYWKETVALRSSVEHGLRPEEAIDKLSSSFPNKGKDLVKKDLGLKGLE